MRGRGRRAVAARQHGAHARLRGRAAAGRAGARRRRGRLDAGLHPLRCGEAARVVHVAALRAATYSSLVTGGTPGLCSDRCQQRRCLPRPVPLLKGHASLIRARHESSAATPSPKNPAAGEPGTGRGRTSYSWCAARRRLDTAMPWPCRRSSSSPFAAAPATSSCVTCADSRESVEMRSATWTCGSLADAGVTCDPAGAACGPARAAHCLSTRTRSAAALPDARLPACTQARAQTQTRAHANPAPPRPRARTAQVT